MAVPANNNVAENSTTTFKYGVINLTLENQMVPKDKLEQTPSRIDGLDKETENDLRFYGSNLIQKYGIMLKLPQVAMATGQILFQRFYYAKSFIKHPYDIYAMGSLCAASKIEESPRRIRDVINVHYHEKLLRDKQPITSMPLDANYTFLKQSVIKAERRILRELGFCVHVQHAHKFIITLLKVMELINKDLTQFAWNLMNDSLRTNVFLLYPPEQVAAACIHLSSLIQNIPLPKVCDEWFSILNLTEEEVTYICKLILSAYSNVKPNIKAAEARVEELHTKLNLARSKAKLLAGDQLINTNHLSTFSPNSKTTSPNKNNDTKKDSSSKESSQRYKRSRSRTRSPSVSPRKRKRYSVSSRSHSSSQSPKYRGKTPPRSYKDHRRSRHNRGDNYSRHHKSHKSSRSYSRSPSPINHHTSSNYHSSSSNKRSSNYKDKSYSSSKSHHHHDNRNSTYDYGKSSSSTSHHKSSKKDRSSTKDVSSRHSRSSPYRDRRR